MNRTDNDHPARADVRFKSGGVDCAAWLYTPDGKRPFATIVMAHGLGGIRQMRLHAFAERFPGCKAVLITMDSALLEWPCDGRVYRVLRKPVELEDLVQLLATCRPSDAS